MEKKGFLGKLFGGLMGKKDEPEQAVESSASEASSELPDTRYHNGIKEAVALVIAALEEGVNPEGFAEYAAGKELKGSLEKIHGGELMGEQEVEQASKVMIGELKRVWELGSRELDSEARSKMAIALESFNACKQDPMIEEVFISVIAGLKGARVKG